MANEYITLGKDRKKRVSGILGFIGVAIVVGILIRLVFLCLFDTYGFADNEAFRTIGVTETENIRGTIYDNEMNELAYSSPAYNIVLSPYDILEVGARKDQQEKIDAANTSSERKAAEDKLEIIVSYSEKKAKQIAQTLSSLFPEDIDMFELLRDIEKNAFSDDSAYFYYAERHIEDYKKKQIEKSVTAYNDTIDVKKDSDGHYARISLTTDLYFENTQKRVYPYGPTGATFLGYVNKYDVVRGGIEGYYDSRLQGMKSRRITGRGVNGIVTSLFDKTFKGEESVNAVSTVNIKIQEILETAISEAQRSTMAESVHGVVMNTKTGAVLAMASTPGFDPNSPGTPLPIETEYLQFRLEKEKAEQGETPAEPETAPAQPAQTAEEETTSADGQAAEENKAPVYDASKYPKYVIEAAKENEVDPETYLLLVRTQNRALSYYLDPGSVYKAFLVSGATEEGIAIDFNCGGSYEVRNSDVGDGTNRIIYCANYANHGYHLDGEELLRQSCNIAAAQLGLAMGEELFYKYYQAFGFTSATGIDLTDGDIPPASYLYHSSYAPIDLATCSFGQNNKITSLQIAAAMSAIGNGGHLMKPFIVSKLIDNDGNVVESTEPTEVRQVISAETSSTVRGYLETVVAKGGGSRAALENYRVSGKTGTSQIINERTLETTGHVASFAGFAPTSDPEITVVINIYAPDESSGDSSEYLASNIAAPVAGKVLGQALEYLGIPYDKN